MTLTHRPHKTVNIATLAVHTLDWMIFGAMKPSSGVLLQYHVHHEFIIAVSMHKPNTMQEYLYQVKKKKKTSMCDPTHDRHSYEFVLT